MTMAEWISPDERLPECGPVKQANEGWLVVGSNGRKRWETCHPGYWNEPSSIRTGETIYDTTVNVVLWLDGVPDVPQDAANG